MAIKAHDGAVLRAWLVSPEICNGNCVITLHGVADCRRGTLGLAQLFVENHYTVLMADSRGHGESGSEIATSGLLERDDVHRWVDWLICSEHPRNVFWMGESLGAGILIQSPAVEHRFSAVVAESSFANFEEIAEYGLHNGCRLADWPAGRLRSLWCGQVFCTRDGNMEWIFAPRTPRTRWPTLPHRSF